MSVINYMLGITMSCDTYVLGITSVSRINFVLGINHLLGITYVLRITYFEN